MRIIIALLLAFPIYNELGTDSLLTFVCVIALQILAGLDFKLGRK